MNLRDRLLDAVVAYAGRPLILAALGRAARRHRQRWYRDHPHSSRPGPTWPAEGDVVIDAGYLLLGDTGNAVEPILHAVYRYGVPWEDVDRAVQAVLDAAREEDPT